MDIALIAEDNKKELMAQFCIAYSGILSKHNLYASYLTGKYISDASGLEIETFLAGGAGGIDRRRGGSVHCRPRYGKVSCGFKAGQCPSPAKGGSFGGEYHRGSGEPILYGGKWDTEEKVVYYTFKPKRMPPFGRHPFWLFFIPRTRLRSPP